MHDTVTAQKRTLAGVLLLNIGVSVAKLTVGFSTGAISMVADGFHSITDAAATVVGLIGISLAAQPPDADHPYGHRKFETLASMIIGGLLAMTSWEILRGSIDRLRAGSVPEVGVLSFSVMAVTIAINLLVSHHERRRARELNSEILAADAAHTMSDVYTSLAVVTSLIAARLGISILDPLAAIVITVVIAHTAFQILRHSAAQLADTAVIPAARIEEVALTVPGADSVHKIRTRGRPPAAHADLHVQVRPDLRLDQAHVIGHLVAERLRQELGLADVVAHVEPPTGHRTTWRPDR